MLEQLSGPAVAIDGVFWASPGEVVGINSLTAKILCVRHNSALSPLDTEAGQLADREAYPRQLGHEVAVAQKIDRQRRSAGAMDAEGGLRALLLEDRVT